MRRAPDEIVRHPHYRTEGVGVVGVELQDEVRAVRWRWRWMWETVVVAMAVAARHLQRLRKVFECLRVLPLLLEKDAAVVPRVRIPGRQVQRLRIIFESLVELPLYL